MKFKKFITTLMFTCLGFGQIFSLNLDSYFETIFKFKNENDRQLKDIKDLFIVAEACDGLSNLLLGHRYLFNTAFKKTLTPNMEITGKDKEKIQAIIKKVAAKINGNTDKVDSIKIYRLSSEIPTPAFAIHPNLLFIREDHLRKLDNGDKTFEFLVGHEVSHIIHNDNFERGILNIITPVGIFILSKFLGLACKEIGKDKTSKNLHATMNILANIIQYPFTRIFVKKLLIKGTSRNQENRADIDSVKALNTAEGGINFLKNLAENNKNYRNQKNIPFLLQLYRKIQITADGDFRSDLDHPSFESRIENIKKFMASTSKA